MKTWIKHLPSLLAIGLWGLTFGPTFASVKVRGGGGDFNLRLIEAKQMAVAMMANTAQNPQEFCQSAVSTEQCEFFLAHAQAMATSLENSKILPASACFQYSPQTQTIIGLETTVKPGAKSENAYCFSDQGINDKMMTFEEMSAPVFVNINKALALDLATLTKLFIHESFHHIGVKDDYESGVESNLPDLGAEIIYLLNVVGNPDYLKKMLASRYTTGLGIDSEKKFELVWTSVARGTKNGWGYKAKDSLLSLRGLVSPAPEFYVQIELCNRTMPVECENLVDLRDELKVVRDNKLEKFNESVSFTGDELNMAYHRIHSEVHGSGDPAGHDLHLTLIEDDFGMGGDGPFSNKEIFAEWILPVESLFIGLDVFKIHLQDKGESGRSGKETGASADVELKISTP